MPSGGRVTPRSAAPVAIERRDDGIRITWDAAGHEALYPARWLRLSCPCAACVDEMSGRAVLDPGTVPADLTPLRVSLVGAYALRVAWSDGHGTGLYTFEWLRLACPCPRCAGPAPGQPGVAEPPAGQ